MALNFPVKSAVDKRKPRAARFRCPLRPGGIGKNRWGRVKRPGDGPDANHSPPLKSAPANGNFQIDCFLYDGSNRAKAHTAQYARRAAYRNKELQYS